MQFRKPALHAECTVGNFLDVFFGERLPIAGPTGARFKLRLGVKQCGLAANALRRSGSGVNSHWVSLSLIVAFEFLHRRENKAHSLAVTFAGSYAMAEWQAWRADPGGSVTTSQWKLKPSSDNRGD